MTAPLPEEICALHGAAFVPADPAAMLGLAKNARPGNWPIHGLRHPIEGGTCGWYVWAVQDEIPEDPSLFEPINVAHVSELLPEAIPYLALPPGWRFLLAPGYADVWYDPDLLYT
jgi:hypothetical protein